MKSFPTLSLHTLFVLLLALAVPVWAQPAKEKAKGSKTTSLADEKRPAAKLNIIIHEVVKEDAKAKIIAEGRLIPVRFVWLCGSTGNAKLAELEAKLITLNTDGKSTTVTKRLTDWTVNKPITSVIDLPMPKDVFAKSFTLELVGKFTDGKFEHAVNASKQGNFPVPNVIDKKR